MATTHGPSRQLEPNRSEPLDGGPWFGNERNYVSHSSRCVRYDEFTSEHFLDKADL
jgi:hypothetical protein